MTILAAYNFDQPGEVEAAGVGNVIDEVGNHHADVVGTVTIQNGPISRRSRFLPNSTGSRIDIPHGNGELCDATGDFSVEIWTTPTVVNFQWHQFLKRTGGGSYPFLFAVDTANKFRVGANDGSQSAIATSPAVAVAGQLEYLVFGWDASERTAYLGRGGIYVASAQNLALVPANANNTSAIHVSRDDTASYGGYLHALRFHDILLEGADLQDTFHGTNLRGVLA
jgi:hypothetical protein